jgi:hypothetical protein
MAQMRSATMSAVPPLLVLCGSDTSARITAGGPHADRYRRYDQTVACDACNAHFAGWLPYVCDLNPYTARRHRLGGTFHRDRGGSLGERPHYRNAASCSKNWRRLSVLRCVDRARFAIYALAGRNTWPMPVNTLSITGQNSSVMASVVIAPTRPLDQNMPTLPPEPIMASRNASSARLPTVNR